MQAQVRARQFGITADVMTRTSHASAGYWEIVQDALADLVRIMLWRCHDQNGHPELYEGCRCFNERAWMVAFPNVFVTITAAEWKFPRPYWLQPYLKCVFAGAYALSLHMFLLVRTIWYFLANPLGHKYFTVYEWVNCTSELLAGASR